MNRMEELVLKFVDGELPDDEARELNGLIQSVNNSDSFLRLLEIEAILQSSSYGSVADQVVESLRLERRQRIEDGVMSVVAGSLDENQAGKTNLSRYHWLKTHVVGSYRHLAFVAGITALAMIVAFSVRSGLVEPRSDSAPTIAELIAHESSVEVHDVASGTMQTTNDADPSMPLFIGQSVETLRSMDSAEIVYADGTRIELLGPTKAILQAGDNGAKRLTVVSGVIQADVAPQPADRPFKIVTNTATLEVLGTTLGVEVAEASTQLEVTSGVVAMTRRSDGRRVDVSDGQFVRATVSSTDTFAAAPFPKLPDTWSSTFGDGLPTDWSAKLIATANGFAMQATPAGRNFGITTQNAWQQGEHALFQVHDDSVLHFRFRQSEFARITVMIGARAYPPEKGRFGANLFYTRKAWNEDLDANTWKTVSVPLRDVDWHIRKRVKQGGAPGLRGLAAYLVHVTTMQRDTGLTIDRIWVTREEEQ